MCVALHRVTIKVNDDWSFYCLSDTRFTSDWVLFIQNKEECAYVLYSVKSLACHILAELEDLSAGADNLKMSNIGQYIGFADISVDH